MFLKKLVSSLIYPLPVCVFLIVFGLVLTWFTQKQKAGKIITTVGTVLLLICDFRPISGGIADALESRYQSLMSVERLIGVKWVVVLGSGWAVNPTLPSNLQMHPIGLSRLVEGIRVHRAIPGSKLILSGGKSFSHQSHAEIMADTAVMLGVKREDIVLEKESQDTADEARLIKEIVGKDPLVLVTSAMHLPRSMGLFEKKGMKPIPAPADRWVVPGKLLKFADFIPDSRYLEQTDRSYHEYMGTIWAKLRGTL